MLRTEEKTLSEGEKARCDKVREDLRKIRRLNGYVDSALKARQRYMEQIGTLAGEKSEKATHMRKVLEGKIERLGIEKAMDELERLEAFYFAEVENMDPIDRTIITRSMIEGESLLDVSREIYYSVDGVKWRLRRIVKRMSEKIDE